MGSELRLQAPWIHTDLQRETNATRTAVTYVFYLRETQLRVAGGKEKLHLELFVDQKTKLRTSRPVNTESKPTNTWG